MVFGIRNLADDHFGDVSTMVRRAGISRIARRERLLFTGGGRLATKLGMRLSPFPHIR